MHRGRPILLANPASNAQLDRCGDLFSISRKRSALQDLRFPIEELVELAARALSPGVNDPFTAIACIDWLGAALDDLADLQEKPSVLRDANGEVRVIIRRLDFGDYLEASVGRLHPYVARDPNALEHLVRTLDVLRASVANPAHRALVDEQCGCLAREARQGESPRDGS